MKSQHTCMFILSSLLVLSRAQAADIEFNIQGVRSDEGKLYIQLFKGEENYQSGQPESANIVKAKSGAVKISFNNVDEGVYAVRFYHDENNNGEMETNMFGMPTEGYGFSNDAKPNYGPVDFSEMKFTVSAADKTVNNAASVIY